MNIRRLFLKVICIHLSCFVALSVTQNSANDFKLTFTANEAKLPNEILRRNESKTEALREKLPANKTASPCTMTVDEVYHGVLVDCSERGIQEIDPGWFPSNTTTIRLENNTISRIRNGTFQHLTSLRFLNISTSSVRTIEVDILRGLHRLEILNLEYNYLEVGQHKFPLGMFQHVPDLKELYIAYNSDWKIKRIKSSPDCKHVNISDCNNDNYSQYIDIFIYLKKIHTLSIDAFEVMCMGEEFANLTQLTNLTIFCGRATCVKNDSFVGLETLQVKHLTLEKFYKPINEFGPGVFKHLPHLDSLIVDVCNIGNHNFLATLWPFENRTMSSLYFNNLNFLQYEDTPNVTFTDGTITPEVAVHLNRICVTNFTWTYSKLFGLHPFALSKGLFAQCVKVLDFSNNQMGISEWKVIIFQFSLFRLLESLTFTYTGADFDVNDPANDPDNSIDYTNVKNRFRINAQHLSDSKFWKDTNEHSAGRVINSESPENDIRINEVDNCSKNILTFTDIGKTLASSNAVFYARVPKTLRVLKINDIFRGVARMRNMTYQIVNADNVRELYFARNSLYIVGHGRLLGLRNLQLLDISGSIFFKIDDDFFDEPEQLTTLIMQSMQPLNFFVNVPLPRILRNKYSLINLDISDNNFNYLWPDLFVNNPALKTLNIAKNRFTNVPFQMRLTPQLEFLDLTHNAIYIIDKDERLAMDWQVTNVGRFELNIQDNAIDCACPRIEFLAWLQTTSVTLDNKGNYTCISQDGVISYTAKISDIPAFWRICNGSMILLWSFILASAMIVFFLSAFLLVRFRFALEAFALRIFAGAFRPMTREDYKTNVFIGYADQDVLFVKNILIRYLEDEQGVTTFIHHRDMRPGYTDQQFFTAIRDSWRVLLVISEEFLNRYDLAHVVMKYASHSVTPVNQDRIFALVQETQINQLPDYLHGVLDNSRILLIQDLHQHLDNDHKRKIKCCLK